MKTIKLIVCITLFLMLAVAVNVAFKKSDQIRSEYMTAQVIRAIEIYLRENNGQWPDSPKKIESQQYDLNRIKIDYTISSKDIINNPDLLKKSITSASGEFYTYPNYDNDLRQLLITINETNRE